MTDQLTSKVALVTGGAKRIGRAIALRLAQEGMDVAFTYHTSEEQAREISGRIEQMGRRVLAIKADLADPNATDQIYKLFTDRFDQLDALVNNAARFATTAFGTVTANQLQQYMAINATTPLMLIQKLAALLAARYQTGDPHSTGRVVNLVDTHATNQPLKNLAAYNVSKAALLEVTKTAAVELAPKVTVNALALGAVTWPKTTGDEFRERYLARVPLRRCGTMDEVAAAALFLIRDAGYCTGEVIRLDGGRLLS